MVQSLTSCSSLLARLESEREVSEAAELVALTSSAEAVLRRRKDGYGTLVDVGDLKKDEKVLGGETGLGLISGLFGIEGTEGLRAIGSGDRLNGRGTNSCVRLVLRNDPTEVAIIAAPWPAAPTPARTVLGVSKEQTRGYGTHLLCPMVGMRPKEVPPFPSPFAHDHASLGSRLVA